MTEEDSNPQQEDGTWNFIEVEQCRVSIDKDGNLHMKGNCDGMGINKNEIHLADRFKKILEK